MKTISYFFFLLFSHTVSSIIMICNMFFEEINIIYGCFIVLLWIVVIIYGLVALTEDE